MKRFRLSNTSKNRLSGCYQILQDIINDAIVLSPVDFIVVCGYRDEKDQNKAYAEGKSELKWPYGKHNKRPSKAVDLCPFIEGKCAWLNIRAFYMLAGVIFAIAKSKNIELVWGGHWKSLKDYPHFELKGDWVKSNE